MLKIPNKVLLVTYDDDLTALAQDVAKALGIVLEVGFDLSAKARQGHNVIICDSACLSQVNKYYAYKTVVVLNEAESFVPYVNLYDRFVFYRRDRIELAYAMYRLCMDERYMPDKEPTVKGAIERSGKDEYMGGDCMFFFRIDEYWYKGEALKLSQAEKIELANYLLLGIKNQATRTYLYRIRKRVGKDFLAHIPRRGRR